jgi:hypothetical protein
VISTAGRAGRFADDVRAPGEGGDCGVAYVSRMYRALPGAPQPDGFPSGALYRGYLSIVFPQDDGTRSTLIVRDDAADDLSELRHNAAFDAVVPLIPQLAPWTEPSAYEPITDVLVGGRLTNNYRGQLDAHGEIPVSGLYFAGDTVCTTNPSAGRGASLGLLQARELVRLIDGGAADHRATALAFDAWCTEQIRPWYDDHVTTDKTLLERFRGDEPDEHHPITSDVICDAAQDNPSLMPVVGPYLGMLAPPSTLDAARETVRGMLAEGWRPPYGDGPSRADLVDVIGRTVPA